MRILVNGMYGFGDNMYQLAFVRTLAEAGNEVTIVTPWPELYEDLPKHQFSTSKHNTKNTIEECKAC